MRHVKLSVKIMLVVAVLTLGIATVALAHGEATPPPYAGLKNPFPWDDAGAQSQGKALYTKTCVGCHGVNGGNVAAANFASSAFPSQLEAQPDHYFWVVSEGISQSGMPSFRSSLGESERWQLLVYLHSLHQSAAAAGTGTAAPILGGGPMFLNPTVGLNVVDDNSGLVLTASLRDAAGKPVRGETVTFWLKKEFFATDWMQVNEATSNQEGKASVEYAPSELGNVQFAARWDNLEATSGFDVTSRSKSYQAKAGIRLPSIGPEVAVGLDLGQAELGEASPTGGFRLPGGTLSWLLLFVGVIIMIWTTYFRVFRQVIMIPESSSRDGITVKLVPYFAMVFVLVVGAALAFVILHGPYTHLDLGR